MIAPAGANPGWGEKVEAGKKITGRASGSYLSLWSR